LEKTVIYEIPSLFRDDFRIRGYRFGSGRKSLCIVGNVRGNEYQQIYICSQVVAEMKKLEAAGLLCEDREVLIVPSLNPSSMNIGKRFWPTDNTDINRMFPGYALGETTQRIADGVFKVISEYENGIQLASFYMPGRFSPHVRLMNTGYANVSKAHDFGLPYIVKRIPRPYDTTTLNYNWQLWETDAYSLYSTTTSTIDEAGKDLMIEAILRFMRKNGILKSTVESQEAHETGHGANHTGENKAENRAKSGTKTVTASRVFQDRTLVSVRPSLSGIYQGHATVNQSVAMGACLAEILDAHEGHIIQRLISPVDGVVFFHHDAPLVYANTAVLKILPNE
jgi:predicted deacylase